ncbi:MAG: LexA family protein [Anaerolineaceae bacterium]|jgi:repressor LexA
MKDRLRKARKAKGLTQAELGEKVSISRQAYSTYETGKRDPDTETIAKIASVLDVSLDYLLGKTLESGRNINRIPILGSVPAGTPIEAIEDIEEYIDIYPKFVKHGELFALRVQGDSMEPDIRPGDIVIVEKQEFVTNGDVAVVRVNGEDVTVKKVKQVADGLLLMPNNPAYEPTFFSADDVANLPVTIIGRVIEIRRRL